MKNKFKFLAKYLKTSLIPLIFAFFASIIFIPSTLLIPLFVGKGVDVFVNVFKNNLDFSLYFNEAIKYIAIIILLVILVIIFQYLYESILNVTFEKIIKNIRDDLFIKLNKVETKYLDNKLYGDLISRSINDVENISTGLISGFKQFYQGVISIIFTIGFMFYANYLLALIILILTPLSFLISFYVARRSNKYFKKQAKLVGDLCSIVLEDFNNIEIIKSFNFEEQSFNKFKKINEQLNVAGQKAQFVSSFTNPSTRLINNSIYAIVGIIGALIVVFGEKRNIGATLTVGGITAFLQYANQFAKPLNEISSCVSEIQAAFVSINRIQEVFDEQNDKNDGKNILNEEIKSLKVEDVSFGYNEKLIYKDLNFEIKKGQKIALVGPTGCGKTTIINLILRFYDVNSGQILINDQNINDFDKASYRDKFGIVLQDSWIFKGTVYENIIYGSENATKNDVIEASKKANCYEFIKRLPKGFDTIISDDSGLSNGEKQLICIARVMLKNNEFLILDEATSNVDTRTELKIGKALDELMKNKTSIIIAHRLSTIVSSDLILVVKDGVIIEQGNHKDLLNKNGFYKELFNSQYR